MEMRSYYKFITLLFFIVVVIIVSAGGVHYGKQFKDNTQAIKAIQSADIVYINDGARLYMSPDEDSQVLWYFTPGDIVQVKKINKLGKEYWVEVVFTGQVKAGFEGLRTPPLSTMLSGSSVISGSSDTKLWLQGVKIPMTGWVTGDLRYTFGTH